MPEENKTENKEELKYTALEAVVCDIISDEIPTEIVETHLPDLKGDAVKIMPGNKVTVDMTITDKMPIATRTETEASTSLEVSKSVSRIMENISINAKELKVEDPSDVLKFIGKQLVNEARPLSGVPNGALIATSLGVAGNVCLFASTNLNTFLKFMPQKK